MPNCGLSDRNAKRPCATFPNVIDVAPNRTLAGRCRLELTSLPLSVQEESYGREAFPVPPNRNSLDCRPLDADEKIAGEPGVVAVELEVVELDRRVCLEGCERVNWPWLR